MQQGEEEADLGGFDLRVTQFIDLEHVVGEVVFEDLGLGVVGDGLVEFGDELGKEDVTAGFALVDGVGEEAGGQARFADARRA